MHQEGEGYAGPVRFDGRQLWVVGPDGTDVPIADPVDERDAWTTLVLDLQQRLVRIVRDQPVRHAARTLLAIDPNPPYFRAIIDDYLLPSTGDFNNEPLRANLLEIDRFFAWSGLIDRLQPLQGSDVLLSGCGAGGSVLTTHAFGPRIVVGTEVDHVLAHLAQARTSGVPGAHVVHISGDLLPFPDQAFDVIESVDVLEHVVDPTGYLREHARVLRPGGLMLIGVPNRAYPVEQHLGVVGPPWMPVRVANRVFATAARLPGVPQHTRQRWEGVTTVRTHNISQRKVEVMAAGLGLEATRIHRRDHPTCWPMAPDPRVVEAMTRLPATSNLAPTTQVVMALRKPARD